MPGHPADTTAESLTVADFSAPQGPDLLARTAPMHAWIQSRVASRSLPYFWTLETPPGVIGRVRGEDGRVAEGMNFGVQDYLGLARHPAIREAVLSALDAYGPTSAGSGLLQGGNPLGGELKRELAELVATEHVALYPTGWAAGFGSVVALVRPYDHVVMDQLAHACLQQGANASTRQVVRHPHLDVAAAREAMRDIRARDTRNGILVITEGLFSMDADTPRLRDLQAACREFGATLLVDVAHDLGALGPGGSGQLGTEGLLGEVDIVMGSFSKTFATSGGFVAAHSPAVLNQLRVFGGSFTFSAALSPLACAIALEAARIIRSPEGDRLRERLRDNAQAMRDALARGGIDCLGIPCAIVAAPAGADALGRVASGLVFERGVLANFVEFPAVARNASRFRIQLTPQHTAEQVREAASIIVDCVAQARTKHDENGGQA